MSTVQRWQTPVSLSIVLIAAILFVLALGLRIDARAVAGGQPTLPVDASTPAPTVCPATPAATTLATPTPLPAPIGINQNVSGSSNLSVAGRGNQTQGNDGGFGDVGLQFQNVNVLAPIDIVHISNEGSGNTNSVNFGPAAPVTTSTPATADPTTPMPATADPTTPTTAPTAGATPDTVTRIWAPPTVPAPSDPTATSSTSSTPSASATSVTPSTPNTTPATTPTS